MVDLPIGGGGQRGENVVRYEISLKIAICLFRGWLAVQGLEASVHVFTIELVPDMSRGFLVRVFEGCGLS